MSQATLEQAVVNNKQVDEGSDKAALENAIERTVEYMPEGSTESIKVTIGQVREFLTKKSKKGYRPEVADCVRFMMLCKARALNPWEGDAFLVGYDSKDGSGAEWSLITSHQALLKRAHNAKEYKGKKSGVIVLRDGKVVDLDGAFYLDSDKLVGGWCLVKRKEMANELSKLRLSSRAKQTKFWNDDQGGMIMKCAEAAALRAAFPNVVGGLYVSEEMNMNVIDDVIDQTEKKQRKQAPKRTKVEMPVAKRPEKHKPAKNPTKEDAYAKDLQYAVDMFNQCDDPLAVDAVVEKCMDMEIDEADIDELSKAARKRLEK